MLSTCAVTTLQNINNSRCLRVNGPSSYSRWAVLANGSEQINTYLWNCICESRLDFVEILSIGIPIEGLRVNNTTSQINGGSQYMTYPMTFSTYFRATSITFHFSVENT